MQAKLEKAEAESSQLREMLSPTEFAQALTHVVSSLQIRSQDKQQITGKKIQSAGERGFGVRPFLGKPRPSQLSPGSDGS